MVRKAVKVLARRAGIDEERHSCEASTETCLSARSVNQSRGKPSQTAEDSEVLLWASVLEFVRARETALRSDVAKRFADVARVNLGRVLDEPVGCGKLFRTGRGEGLMYRAATTEEMELLD
jgi:hypothetical protein